MKFKILDSQMASWIAPGGNEYTPDGDGIIAIPDELGADIEAAKASGLFGTVHEVTLGETQTQAERLGGSTETEPLTEG